jgi:hypothetical protein
MPAKGPRSLPSVHPRAPVPDDPPSLAGGSRGLGELIPGAFALVGPKDELLAGGRQDAAFIFVWYPYLKGPHIYLSIRGVNEIHCCQCDTAIRVPKRKMSTAAMRRFTRHILSHHRRHRRLLTWFDGLDSLRVVVRRVATE